MNGDQFTIMSAQAWSPNPLQIAAMVGGFVLFASLLFLWTHHLNKKDRKAAEHIRKGGKPRTFTEHKAKFFRDLAKDVKEVEEPPHLLTCSHGIIRYRLKIPKSLKFIASFAKEEDTKQIYMEIDEEILKLLSTD